MRMHTSHLMDAIVCGPLTTLAFNSVSVNRHTHIHSMSVCVCVGVGERIMCALLSVARSLESQHLPYLRGRDNAMCVSLRSRNNNDRVSVRTLTHTVQPCKLADC